MKSIVTELPGWNVLFRSLINTPVIEPKPMRDEGLPPPQKFLAKPTTYKPSPNNPPRCGSKRKRQWR